MNTIDVVFDLISNLKNSNSKIDEHKDFTMYLWGLWKSRNEKFWKSNQETEEEIIDLVKLVFLERNSGKIYVVTNQTCSNVSAAAKVC